MMKTLSISIVAGLAVLLAACATPSAYKPAEKRGDEGYTETRLGENRYRISFVGNTATPAETVKDYALLRAAELTLQQGYSWFRIVERDADKKTSAFTSSGGGFSVPGHTAVYRDCGVLSCRTTVAYSPGFSTGIGVSSTTTSTAYTYQLEVQMGKPPMPKDADAYNAQELASTIRQWMQAQPAD